MKVKFTKLAALLLAGAALLAAGCTDYEVDIQQANKRIDQLDKEKATVASLEEQGNALRAMISQLEKKHDDDVKTLRGDIETLDGSLGRLRSDFDANVAAVAKEISDLKAADDNFTVQVTDLFTKYQNLYDNKADKTELAKVQSDLLEAIAGEKARAEKAEKDLEDAIKEINEVTIPALQAQIKNIEEVVIPALQQDIQDLKDGKVDKVDFEAYKKETAQTIKLMKDAIGDLSKLTTTNKESLVDAVNEVVAKLDDYVLKTTFEEFVKIAATKQELKDLETALDGRLDVLEALLAGDWGKDVTVKGYIDDKVTNLQNQINNIVNVLIPGLDERVTKLETTVYEQVVPQIAFAMDYEGYYTYTNGLEGYIIDSMYDAYLSAVEYTDEYMEWLVDQLNEIFDDIYNTLDLILSRVQSVVYVPDYDDQKMTMNLVYYSDYAGHFLVVGKETEVEYRVNPADAFVNLQALQNLIKKDLLAFDVKEVKTRADGEEKTNDPKLDILRATKYDPATGKFTLVVRPNNIVSAAFADYQINPSAMYFALLNNKPINKGSEMQIVKDEDGNYKIINVPFFADYASMGYEDVVQTGTETIVDKEAWDEWVWDYWYYFWGYPVGHWQHHEAETHEEPIYTTYVWYAYTAEDLAKYAQAIADLQDALNNFVEEDVEKFNELVTAYNEAVDAYNAALASYFKALQRRTSARNYAVALNIYTSAMEDYYTEEVVENPTTNISSTYTTLYPSKYEESEKIIIEKDPFRKGEMTDKGNVKAYGDRNQNLEFNSKETKEILESAIPAVTIVSADGTSVRTLSYDQAAAEGYLVVDPTWSNADITYVPADEEKYFVVKNDFEDKVPPYATVRMNYDEYNNAVLKGRVDDVVKGVYTLKDNMFGNEWTWAGTVTVVPPTANIDLTLPKPIEWTYANDADVDHNRFYETEGNKEYFRVDQPIVINTDLAKIAEEYGITPADLIGIEPTDKTRSFIKYDVEEVDAKGAKVAYEVRFVDGAYVAYQKDEVAEAISPLKISHVDLDAKKPALEMNITNFEWDKTYSVTANYYYLEGGKVSVIVAVNLVFNTFDRNREPVTLPVNEFTFDINGFDAKTGFGYIANAEDAAASWYKWRGASQQAEIKAAFETVTEAGLSVTKAADFKDLAAFAAAELTQKVFNAAKPGNAYGYVGIDDNDQHGFTTENFVASVLQKFAQKDEKGNFVQDKEDPYKFLGQVIYRNITTYIGEEVIIPFQFNWKVPAYDFLHQTNYTFDDGKWYTMASPKYDLNKQALKKYDVNYMNVPALAFNIIDAKKRFFNYRDENIAATDPTYFYDENVLVNFFYTGPDPVDTTPLEAQSQTGDIKTYGDLWFDATVEGPYYDVDEAKNFQHTVFYYRSIRDAIPMYGTLDIKSGDAIFPIPTSFEKGNGGKYVAEKDYSNFELRAWKPFYVPTYSQKLTLDLNEHKTYRLNILEGIQFYDVRQVAASTPTTNNNEFDGEGVYSIESVNYGTKGYFRPMLGFNGNTWGFVMGNAKEDGTAAAGKANGFYEGVTSWEAYDLQVKDFNFTYDSTVSPDLRRLISITDNYVLEFDYNSQIEFQNTAKVQFSFDFETPWQRFGKPFMIEVTIRGLNEQ